MLCSKPRLIHWGSRSHLQVNSQNKLFAEGVLICLATNILHYKTGVSHFEVKSQNWLYSRFAYMFIISVCVLHAEPRFIPRRSRLHIGGQWSSLAVIQLVWTINILYVDWMPNCLHYLFSIISRSALC